jgi:selenocysteine lyase/cysteine desulfurase
LAVDQTATPADCRRRFPIFDRLTYINSCSQGALSQEVRQAYEAYLHDWDEKGAPWQYWVERADTARASFARLVNGDPDEVAVTTSVSAGVSAVATGLDLSKRPRIVVTDLEFPTIGQIWHAQEARGAEIVHVSADDPERVLEQLRDVVDERTALVSVTAVCYRNGVRLPVDEIAALARERGALTLLDAYQALGTYPVDVATLGVDFVAGGALKYLLGSAGLAFLWARRELVETTVPLATGWFADQNVFEMDVSDYSPSPTARRFESGTPPIPAIYAGIAGMELIQEIGVAATREHVQGLNARLIDGVEELGGTVATPADPERRGALVCIRSTDSPALVAALASDGVVTSERDGNLRVSAHCYNTTEDVDVVLESLVRHRRLLRTA